MGGANSSSKQRAAQAVDRHESGITEAAVSFIEALALFRQIKGSTSTGPATDEEREAVRAMMAKAGQEEEFHPPPPPLCSLPSDVSPEELELLLKPFPKRER